MNKKTKMFLSVLIFIFVSLFLINLFSSKKTETVVPNITPTPAPQGDRNIIEKQEEIRTNKYPLINYTPYKTTVFEVSYIGPLRLRVLMYKDEKDKIASEVESWIKENGVDPKTHQIEYTAPQLP